MRRTALAAVLAAAAFAAAPAFAQTQTPPAASQPEETFTPAHLAAAQEVIRLSESDVIFDDILPRLAEQTRTLFIQSNPALTADIEEVTGEVALGLARRRVELSRTLEEIWARRFTETELGELAAFLNSPVGRKFVETSPTISNLSIGAAQQWEASLAGSMVEEVRAKMRERGYAL